MLSDDGLRLIETNSGTCGLSIELPSYRRWCYEIRVKHPTALRYPGADRPRIEGRNCLYVLMFGAEGHGAAASLKYMLWRSQLAENGP
jgi:hypothetical protein